MKTLILSLAVLLTLGALADSQVTWVVSPDPVPTEQTITMVLTNNTTSGITLPSTAPWSIHTPLGALVFGPFGLSVLVNVPAQTQKTFTWDQKDSNNAFVKPAGYESWLLYYDPNFKMTTLKTPFQIDPDKLTVSGQPAPGASVKLLLSSPTAPKQPYQAALSLSTNPPLPLGGGRLLELTPDSMTLLSLLIGPPIFQNFAGFLDGNGTATATLNIPNAASLKGLTVYAAHVTLNAAAPNGILGYSASRTIQIK